MKKIFLLLLGILLVATFVNAADIATQNLIGTLEEPIPIFSLTVFSPENNGIYNTRKISFNLTTSNESKIIEYLNYNDKNPKLKNLCKNCDEYGFLKNKIKTMSEGENNLTFRATDKFNNIDEKNVEFFIDSIPPKITKTLPKRNNFANGNFEVEFREENPVELILYYGVDNIEVNLNECVLERGKYHCSIFVNLDSYNGQEIEYSFFIKDIVNQTDQSRPIKIKVDNSPPIINEFRYQLDQHLVFWHKNRVSFYFNITEPNFDEITYLDNEDRNPRERALCTRLRNGLCEVTKYFLRGKHNLTIEVKDNAGNSIKIEPVEFTINPGTFE